MCGICGKISLDGKPVEEDLLEAMCRSFSYRGPDDQGIYTANSKTDDGRSLSVGLGHRRLAIIDLSQAGHQPMSNEDGTIWITYNGEVYNFQELRSELKHKGHTFKSDTDTEVILHLYEEKGIHAVDYMNGMFAFAIWDENASRLWVCRDRIGIKPLVYYWDEKHFAFASEIKALLNDAAIAKELDHEALYLYLAFNYVPAPYTMFKGIKKLEPGHYLILEQGELKEKKYWDVAQPAISSSLPTEFADQEKIFKKRLYECLNDAVCKQLIADVPLGAFLSGGIDSSIIVALMALNSNRPVKTFSIGFSDAKLFDETRYSREVAERYNTDHHEFILTYQDMLDVLPDVLSTFDEPFADSSAIPTYIVSRETRKHVTVALSGDGGDELFAGYRSYLGEYWYRKYLLIPAIIREGLLERLVQGFPDDRDTKILEYIRRLKKFIRGTKGSFAERVLALKEIFPQDIRQKLLLESKLNQNPSLQDPALKHVQNLLDISCNDRINTILYADLKDSLPGDMLTKVDWMSMKNSLEVRVPLLDHRVVELVFGMQGALKINKGRTKYILKKTFKHLLPSSLHRRPKAGFEIPLGRWLRTDLKFLIKKYLAEDRIRQQGIFEYDIINSLIRDHLDHRTDTSWMLWNLIVFQHWHENYL